MTDCRICGESPAARVIGICPGCLRNMPEAFQAQDIHGPIRHRCLLPEKPPAHSRGRLCRLCSNACRPTNGQWGYCGLHGYAEGRRTHRALQGSALAHVYLDSLPTNCCASWFCRGTHEHGNNLAVFFYACSFDCLFCQNASHKHLESAPVIHEEDLVRLALDASVRCVCFFGGSPEPQLPFALRVSRRIIEQSGNTRHICWEWNGCGNPALVKCAARLSQISGGTVKFDLKAFHPQIALTLCGVDTSRAFDNFSMLAKAFPQPDLLTATTLLVPYYVDSEEVGNIARFIAALNPDIPYSLLVFHPDFALYDLPVTPRHQAERCLEAARSHLGRVHIGNVALLGL